jgi:uncharacterized coiled-coil DUF342 family protein
MSGRSRVLGLSPREYQARLDLCRLRDLVCMNKSQTEIAAEMGKDAAWVSRSIRRIQEDFSTLYGTPDENRLVRENIANLENLYAEARKTAHESDGFKRISALRLAAEIQRQLNEYEVTVGWVANRRVNNMAVGRAPTMEELRDEISAEDLDAVILDVAESIREKQAKAALN